MYMCDVHVVNRLIPLGLGHAIFKGNSKQITIDGEPVWPSGKALGW